jgi:hypothetical protein
MGVMCSQDWIGTPRFGVEAGAGTVIISYSSCVQVCVLFQL